MKRTTAAATLVALSAIGAAVLVVTRDPDLLGALGKWLWPLLLVVLVGVSPSDGAPSPPVAKDEDFGDITPT